jgi:hypothetical protein
MLFWDIFLFVCAIGCFLRGTRLRRGVNEFFSY